MRQYKTHGELKAYSNSKKVKELGYTCEACGFNFKKVYGKLSLNKKKIYWASQRQIQDLPEGEIVEFKIEDFSVYAQIVIVWYTEKSTIQCR